MKKLYGLLVALAMVVCFSSIGSAADNWPKSTIKVIVPFTAGGGADLMARALAPEISKNLGVSVVVENATGGGGAIAMNKLARSKPDGYTIILTTVGPSTLVPNKSNVGYGTKEFAPIAQVADVPNVVAVRKDSGITTLEQLFAKGETETITYGTSGAGHTQNVQMETLLMLIDKPGLMTHVPFDGGSQAVAALLGGQVNACVCIVPEPLPHIQNGTFLGLCITSSERDPALPDVPTLKELGYALEGGVWYGYAAPANTPPDIIAKLDEAIAKATAMPEIVDVFEKIGSPVQYLNHEAFTEKWLKTFESNKAVMAKMTR